MAQLSNDCFATGGELMRLDKALALIASRVEPVGGRENVSLDEADNRILAADVVAPIDLPPFDNSAVDGFATCFDDIAETGETVLPVTARIAAGDAAHAGARGTTARIFTGAPMPAGFDTVFMQEDVVLEATGRAVLPAGLARGANRRLTGEDVARGTTALAAGRRLGPADIALLGAFGLAEVALCRRLRVAVFSTGDEVASLGEALVPGRLHDANRPMLGALLRRLGCRTTDLGILSDRRADIATALTAAAAGHDLLLTTGGVSTGEEDHVRDAVAGAGSLVLWRIGIKPGRPVAMGVVAGTPFVGLPGNPVAAFVTFVTVARPLIARLASESYVPPSPIPIRAAFPYRKKTGRREYVRVRLAPDAEGQLAAHKHPREGAGIITTLTETDGLVVLPEDWTRVEPGASVDFIPYSALI